jgi:hypothetical protein
MRLRVGWLILSALLLAGLAGQASTAFAAKGFTQGPGSPVAPGVDHLFSVELSDLNADGNLDAVVPDGFGFGVAVLIGDGAGGLHAAPGSPFNSPGGAGPVAIGDFNQDAKPDVAVSNQFLDSVSVLLGDGQGGLAPAPVRWFAAGGPTSDLAAGDFNNDAMLDVAALTSNGASILLGDGQAGFSLAPGSPFSTSDGGGSGSPFMAAVADVDRNTQLDLAVVNRNPVELSVLLGDGNGGFSPAVGSPYSTGGVTIAVASGDFNRDRIPDLAATNNNSSPDSSFGSVAVLLGRGNGGFRAVPGPPSSPARTPCCHSRSPTSAATRSSMPPSRVKARTTFQYSSGTARAPCARCGDHPSRAGVYSRTRSRPAT